MYPTLEAARRAVREAGDHIRAHGLNLPADLLPFTCVVTGTGNVSKGAQSILDLLPTVRKDPFELEALCAAGAVGTRRQCARTA